MDIDRLSWCSVGHLREEIARMERELDKYREALRLKEERIARRHSQETKG